MNKNIVLNRNEYGQYTDKLANDIKEDFDNVINPFLEKYKNIDKADMINICFNEFNYLLSKKYVKEIGDNND